MKAEIIKTNGPPGIVTLVLPSRSEHCFTVCGKNETDLNRIFHAAARERKADMLSRFVFAGSNHHENSRGKTTGSGGCSLSFQGDVGRNGEITSMQAIAVSGTHPRPVKIKGREIGFVYEDEFARYCHLRGLHPEKTSTSRTEQTREVFEMMLAALQANGFLFTDTVRTWFYLDRLLEWYKEFNSVRTAFYQENRIFEHRVPASTGIGAGNAFGSALIANLLAIQPKTSRVKIQPVDSPLQKSPLNYKSSFSRAVEMVFPTHRALLISGTASIGPEGKSAHPGNPALQIDLTMRIIEALLRSRQMDWNDLFRGIVYFKNMEDRTLFDKYRRNHDIPPFPLAVAHTDICRSDLLFEIEVDAVKAAD